MTLNQISTSLIQHILGFFQSKSIWASKLDNLLLRYINLFNGKNFLIKELFVKPKGILSLQKHFHRSEHWVVTQGDPKITLNNKKFFLKPGENIFIPLGSKHRIENPGNKPVKIIEAQDPIN